MSRKRRRDFGGCSIEERGGRLRLRWRLDGPEGVSRHAARSIGLEDTPENRERLAPLSDVIASLLKAGKDPARYLDEVLAGTADQPEGSSNLPLGSIATAETYFQDWIKTKAPLVRKAQLRDYNPHFRRYVLPRLGGVPLSELRLRDIRGLQSELLT